MATNRKQMPNIDLLSLRQQYPQFNDWSDARILRAMARKNAAQNKPEAQGLEGIGEDVSNSLQQLPDAALNIIPGLVSGAGAAGKNVLQHPLRSALNIGAGVGEGAVALGNLPGNIMDYLAKKGIVSQERADKTLHIPDLGIEKRLGLDNPDEGNKFLRMVSSLLVPGKLAKALVPERAVAPVAVGSLAAGENQDPLQASLLAYAGDRAIRGVPGASKKAIDTAKSLPQAISQIPEMAGSTAASALETAADYGSKIPMAGQVLQPTVGALASYLKYKSVPPEVLAKRKLFGDITSEDLPVINERVAAAKRLGLSYLTPGEALLSPFQSAKEANIGRTSAGAKLLYEKGKARSGTEAQAIDNLLDTIYDEKSLNPEKQKSYDDAMGSTVPSTFMDKWKENPIVEHAIKQMDTKPTYRSELAGVPKNSFEYWDIVKRIISDMEGEELKGMKGFSSRAATKVRNQMVDEMDVINPRYENARSIAEREFTRKKLENVFDKKTMTLNNFWSFLKSDKEFNKIMNKLEPFPEAQQKLKDIRLLSNDLIPHDESIRSSYKLEKTGMSKPRNKLDALKQDLDERYGKEHDVAAVNLMTNPYWQSVLTEYLKDKGK